MARYPVTGELTDPPAAVTSPRRAESRSGAQDSAHRRVVHFMPAPDRARRRPRRTVGKNPGHQLHILGGHTLMHQRFRDRPPPLHPS